MSRHLAILVLCFWLKVYALSDFQVILWLIFLGVMIWQHAAKSVQPPLYDPLSYMQKAMSFWEAVEKKTPINPK